MAKKTAEPRYKVAASPDLRLSSGIFTVEDSRADAANVAGLQHGAVEAEPLPIHCLSSSLRRIDRKKKFYTSNAAVLLAAAASQPWSTLLAFQGNLEPYLALMKALPSLKKPIARSLFPRQVLLRSG